jgi:hypothetical protein
MLATRRSDHHTMPSRFGTGDILVALGCLCFLATVVVGAALAPAGATGASAPSDDTPDTLVGVQGVGSYHDGGSVRRYQGDAEQWRESSAPVYFDVTRLDNGSVLAAYMADGYENCGPYDSPCHRTGFRVIDPDADSSPAVEYEWSFPVRNRVASEVHDVEPLPDGGFVVADMEHERVLIVENGEVTWEWEASTRYDAPDDPTTEDWLHINDVDRIGDGRFLVSVRNANQLVVLERGEGVVEVINEDPDGDSDDPTGDPSILYHQHNPQWLGDGAVLVADSENHRVVELHRTDDGTWEPVWVLRGAAGQKFDWPRDADRLPNGNTLITDTRNARLVEVNESGAVVREHQFDYRALPYEADRLPVGEPVGAPTYGDEAADGIAADGHVPVLTPLLRLVSAAVRLPLWVGEVHLFTTLVSIGLVGTGAVIRWRGDD